MIGHLINHIGIQVAAHGGLTFERKAVDETSDDIHYP